MAGKDIVVLAAGKGTRMRTQRPKVLHRLCGLSLLERILRSTVALSPERLLVVVGYRAESVKEEVTSFAKLPGLTSANIRTVVQEPQGGTGHALQIALPHLAPESTALLVVPGDMPLIELKTLAKFSAEAEASGDDLRLLTCKLPDPGPFGRVVRSPSGEVRGIVEAADCSSEERQINEVNSSVYYLRRGVLEEGIPSLSSANAQGELYLTDLVGWAVDRGYRVAATVHPDPWELAGANSIEELANLERRRRQTILKRLMDGGVTFEHPESTVVDEDVEIGPDSIIGPGTQLRGRTRIARGVAIEGGARIVDSTIGEECIIGFGATLVAETVAPGHTVPPLSRMIEGLPNPAEGKGAVFR